MPHFTFDIGSGKTEQLLIASSRGASDYCQRWDNRQHSWRHISEGGFNSRAFEVAPIDQATMIPFCEQHHYAGKPGGILASWGLYLHADLVGVAVLTNGSYPDVLKGAFPKLEYKTESAELGRLVLRDEVPANAESWFLTEAFRQAAARGWRGVVSCSDPVARVDAQGRLIMPGHVGTIYQAMNATYTGLATPRTVWLLPNGVIFNEQAICKIRQQKQGHDYAEAILVSWGAKPKRKRETGIAAWHRMKAEAGLTSFRHHGNHRYLFAIGDRRARRKVVFGFSGSSYPKKSPAAIAA